MQPSKVLHPRLYLGLLSAALLSPLVFCAQQPAAPATTEGALKPAALTTAAPTAPLTVLEETPLHLRTLMPISSTQSHTGAPLIFSVESDVSVSGQIAIPRGARVHGEVVSSKNAGTLSGSATITLRLTSLELEGHHYPLHSHLFRVTGASKTPSTGRKALAGASIGAVAGTVASSVGSSGNVADAATRTINASMGAAAGAAAGTLASAGTPGPAVVLPVESEIEFTLASPITLPQAHPQTIRRLGEAAHPGEPVLYVRGQEP